MTQTTETHAFKTELKQLFDIIVHSLYSNKEVFLRELISNACDAIDKVRFEALTNADLLGDDDDFKIRLVADKEAGTLTIADNGIGMTRDQIVENLGTIAKSGTQAFIEQLREADAADRPELIGQFGVGFYSCLMVADKVTVVSRAAGDDAKAVEWSTDGQGSYTVGDVVKVGRGTDVILHLKADERDYLEPFRLQAIVKKYSDFVEHPIVMDVEREVGEGDDKKTEIVEETFNSQKALWLRPKSEISDEDYTEFYRHLTHHFDEPAKTIHYSAEGTQEFTALVYIPSQRPWDFFHTEPRSGLSLYIKRVFIMDDCDKLLPPYLRFAKGLVDSSDLPLNVSRELLQDNPLLTKIRGALTKRVLGALEEMKKENTEQYREFFKQFGVSLKEGVNHDFANKDRIADLLLFESSKTEPGEFTTLREYVDRSPVAQKEIYFLIGESRELLSASPLLERFKADDREVLFLTDPVDEWLVSGLGQYDEKPLKPIDRGTIDDEEKSDADKEAEKEMAGLFEFLQGKIGDVKAVRVSDRLKESAAVLVSDEGDMGAHMERLMSKLGRGDDVPESKRILEMNASHPAVQAMKRLFDSNPGDERIETYGKLLYDQAVIAEGSKVTDPAGLAKRINALLARDAEAGASKDGE